MASKFKIEKPKVIKPPSGEYTVTDRARTYNIQSYGLPSQYQALEGRKATFIVSANRNSNADFYNIQDAIDKAASLRGGTIFILNGTYKTSNSLLISENIEVIGESQSGVVVDFLNADAGIGFIQQNSNINKTGGIQRVTVQNSKSYGIYFDYTANVDGSIVVPQSSLISIRECSIINSTNGIGISPGYPYFSNFNVAFNSIEVDEIGIDHSSFDASVHIEKNTISAGTGISSVGEAFINRNTITAADIGAELQSPGSANLSFCDNYILSASYGITVIDTLYPASDITINNNRVLSGDTSLVGQNMNDSQVIGNFLESLGGDSVNLDVDSDNNIVIGNNVRNGGITDAGTNNTTSPNTT